MQTVGWQGTVSVLTRVQSGSWQNVDRDRETREGWPLLTVETEVNGGSKSTNERCLSLVGSFRCAGTRDFYPALIAQVSQVQNICFFFALHYFTLYVPIALQPGQAVVQGRRSLNVCLWSEYCKDTDSTYSVKADRVLTWSWQLLALYWQVLAEYTCRVLRAKYRKWQGTY